MVNFSSFEFEDTDLVIFLDTFGTLGVSPLLSLPAHLPAQQ